MLSQAHAREVMLKILTRAGLGRTDTGAVVLTVRETPEELQPEDINKMPLTEFAKLSTVRSHC